jgi:hypothetical protein
MSFLKAGIGEMLALDLILFLTEPREGRIYSINSPFDTDVFKIKVADRWVRQNKARIEKGPFLPKAGVLVFNDSFRNLIIEQNTREFHDQQETLRYERNVDTERSRNRTERPSHGSWSVGNSGRKPMPGGPEFGVHQFEHKWPTGTFKPLFDPNEKKSKDKNDEGDDSRGTEG